jgi:signal transduction histidine kinase
VAGASSLLEEIFAELRSLILQLRPPALEAEGLVTSLAKHLEVIGRMHGVTTRLEATSVGDLGPDTEQALFRIAQEAVTNTVRHASASEVTVRVARDDAQVILTIADDGIGFDPSARAVSARRLGLVSMRERAEDLGGRFSISSAAGHGTTVQAEVPA